MRVTSWVEQIDHRTDHQGATRPQQAAWVRRNRIKVQELGNGERAFQGHSAAMTDRSCINTVILATTVWFAVRVGLHWYFGVW